MTNVLEINDLTVALPKGADRPELPGIDDASGSGDAEENAQTP